MIQRLQPHLHALLNRIVQLQPVTYEVLGVRDVTPAGHVARASLRCRVGELRDLKLVELGRGRGSQRGQAVITCTAAGEAVAAAPAYVPTIHTRHSGRYEPRELAPFAARPGAMDAFGLPSMENGRQVQRRRSPLVLGGYQLSAKALQR